MVTMDGYVEPPRDPIPRKADNQRTKARVDSRAVLYHDTTCCLLYSCYTRTTCRDSENPASMAAFSLIVRYYQYFFVYTSIEKDQRGLADTTYYI